MNRYKVLIVEDDDVMLRLAKNWMHDAKILSESAQKVSEALKMIAATSTMPSSVTCCFPTDMAPRFLKN